MRGSSMCRLSALLLSVALAGCSVVAVGPFPLISVPSVIAAPANEKLDLILVANGVQSYRCDATNEAPGVLEWAFPAPEATLRDAAGRYYGKHYAGPTWETDDGSKVVGTVDARRDAPNKFSLPWLRLKATSTGGAGRFSNITTVLRVSTTGGLPPAPGCSELDRGRIIRIDYTADYYFYVKR